MFFVAQFLACPSFVCFSSLNFFPPFLYTPSVYFAVSLLLPFGVAFFLSFFFDCASWFVVGGAPVNEISLPFFPRFFFFSLRLLLQDCVFLFPPPFFHCSMSQLHCVFTQLTPFFLCLSFIPFLVVFFSIYFLSILGTDSFLSHFMMLLKLDPGSPPVSHSFFLFQCPFFSLFSSAHCPHIQALVSCNFFVFFSSFPFFKFPPGLVPFS